MDDLSQFVNDVAAAPILNLMRESRWRKARDAAKELCKRDRSRYLPLLIEANIGLALELISKGLVTDAATVLAYLETIAPPEVVAGLRTELVTPVAKQTAVVPNPADKALCWAAVLRVNGALAAGTPPVPADLADVDALVADSYRPDPAADDERALQVAKELAAVRVACEATGDGQWELAQEALRGVPGDSVFRHWRLFLRGVRCFFQDQPDTARQCFASLPTGGALARAARALAPGLVPAGPMAPATAKVPLILAMTGQPAGWAPPILAAVTAWKAGKQVKAFEELAAGMKGVFPATEPGLPALLTDAVLPFWQQMTDRDCTVADQLADRYDLWDKRKTRGRPEGVLAVTRAMVLAEQDSMPPADLESCWGRVIELWHRCHGPNPQRDSLAWQWLGQVIAKPHQGGMFEVVSKTDFKRARKALDKALKCDPDNEPAWITLINVLESEGDQKARNRLLDDLAKRFPNNKSVLFKTGMLATERKAYDKGLKALRAALALDPLDKAVKCGIAATLVHQIRDYAVKSRPTAGLWQQLEELLEERPGREHLMLSRWMARMRRSLLDPDRESARAAFEDAVRLAPSPVERLFVESLLGALIGGMARPVWVQDWKAATKGIELKWAILLKCLEYHAFFTTSKGWNDRCNDLAAKLERQLADLLVKEGLKRDLDGVLPFLDQIHLWCKNEEEWIAGAVYQLNRMFYDAVAKATDPKKKAVDPRLQLVAMLLDERFAPARFLPTEALFKKLDSLSAAAEACGLSDVVIRTKALGKRWKLRAEQAPKRSPGPGSEDEDIFNVFEDFDDEDDEDFDEDDEDDDDEDDDEDDIFDLMEDFDDEDDDEDSDVGGHGTDPMMMELYGLMERLALAVMSDNQAALSAVRKDLRKFGMPDGVIEASIAQAKARKSPTTAPPRQPKKSPPPAKKPPVVDPNQIDLF